MLDERRLNRLIEVGRDLVSELDLEAVLKRVLEAAQELTEARYAALGILSDDRKSLDRFITAGIGEKTRQLIGDLPRGRGVLGELIRTPEPLRLGDVSEHPRSYGFPPGHPPMRTFLGVPIAIRGEAYGNLYLTEKGGGKQFDAADEETAKVLAAWAAIAIGNARLYERTETRRNELERAVRGLEATTAIALAVGGETDLARVLELIAKRARALVDAHSLVILLEDGDELAASAAAGELAAETLGSRVPIDNSVAGQVLRKGRPERVADTSSRLMNHPAGIAAASALLVPLIFRGRGLGVLMALDRLGPDPAFRPEDERLMLAFAASAATAVATAKSVEHERLRDTIEASEQERRRWARELHDETLQGLGALRVLLSSALQTGKPEGLETAARDAIDQLATEIDNLRTLITELRPAALDELGLAPAIESLASRTVSVEGVAVAVELDLPPERLPPALESTVYRLVQESLTNAAKHARASRIAIGVTGSGAEVTVEVTDDGQGFDTVSPPPGFGLIGMRERVELADGRLRIASKPGEGTKISAVIPIPAAAAEDPTQRAAG